MRLIDCLPHQPPMRLVEEIVHLTRGETATARRVAKPEDFYFQGHFPGQPVVPAIILIELLAQTGGLAVAAPKAPKTMTPRVSQPARRRDRVVQVSGRGRTGRDTRSLCARGGQARQHVQDRRRSDRRWRAGGQPAASRSRASMTESTLPSPSAPCVLRPADGRLRRGTGSGRHRRRRLHRVLPVLRLSFPAVLGGGIGSSP